jgi:MYXO-CTERM domain-containing protein
MQEPVDNCCVADMDCDDANRGTRDRCQDGTCTNMAVPGFCATDSDCEDEDPCTVDTCDGDVMRCSLEITEECRDETMDQCSVETERTQVMVELGAEQAVREEAARLTIVISRIEADDSLTEVRTLTVDDPNWPVRVALTPENDPLQRFHVGARVDDADGERLARLVARSNFRERRTLLMALTFDEACLGVQCAEGVTCGRGRCRPPQLIATRLPCFAGETSSGGCSATPGSGATASSQPLGLAWLGATLLGLVALRRRRR